MRNMPTRENGFDGAEEAGLGADIVEVAELAHAASDEDIACGGGEDDRGDGGPGVEGGGVHVRGLALLLRRARYGRGRWRRSLRR